MYCVNLFLRIKWIFGSSLPAAFIFVAKVYLEYTSEGSFNPYIKENAF